LSGSGCALPYAWADIPLCGGHLIPVYLPFLIFFAGANIYKCIHLHTASQKSIRNRCNVKGYLENIPGINLTQVGGFDEKMLLDILSVTGADMSKWPSVGHFTSWLNLSPRRQKTGGKVIFV
jgi:hypothetical protein